MARTHLDYDDLAALKRALVGKKIVAYDAKGEPSDYDRVIAFTLDDGSRLEAHAADGGCGCSNGCFTVDTPDVARIVGATIMNVDGHEEFDRYDYTAGKSAPVLSPLGTGNNDEDSATIRVFVYTDLGQVTLVESEGGDNGYYGWGFSFVLHTPEMQS